MMALFDDPDAPKSLTRDSEPEEFFKTNTDKMSDAEKVRMGWGDGVARMVLRFSVHSLAGVYYVWILFLDLTTGSYDWILLQLF